jgi:hypothetical protein
VSDDVAVAPAAGQALYDLYVLAFSSSLSAIVEGIGGPSMRLPTKHGKP